MKNFTASLVSRKFMPVLELRDTYIYLTHDANWSLKNKTNTPHAKIPMAWGGSIRYFYMGHTYAAYFPTQQYFAEHPEYYALVNNKRQPSQLCQTNEDVIRLSIEKTIKIFRDNPDVTITAIGPNDGRGFCDCPNWHETERGKRRPVRQFLLFRQPDCRGCQKRVPRQSPDCPTFRTTHHRPRK